MTSFSISSSSCFPFVTIDICLIKPVECKRKFDLDCRKWLDDPLLLMLIYSSRIPLECFTRIIFSCGIFWALLLFCLFLKDLRLFKKYISTIYKTCYFLDIWTPYVTTLLCGVSCLICCCCLIVFLLFLLFSSLS